MNDKDLKRLICFLKENEDVIEDENFTYLYSELESCNYKQISLVKLEELNKIAIDLEIKYENLTELSNYFDPFYIKLKRVIHENEIKELREKNRQKGYEK